ILSERSDDLRLSAALGRLFRLYSNWGDLQGWSKQEIITGILGSVSRGGCGFGGYNKRHGGGNDDRLHSFLNMYFSAWGQAMTEQSINDLEKLPPGSGFGPKSVRTLRAYCFGDRRVLPLDRPAFRFLQQHCSLYTRCTIDQARSHIESMISSEEGVSLIDFHELLRFRGQTEGKTVGGKELEDVIVGWNAWRLLCSDQRDKITKDWMYQNLVKNKDIANRLWDFYLTIA
ncbi:MAG: hypothetical protein KAX20_07385, partial [Candidatus Omnitrophica bacterium]|nr:hypothetical protein [Candidatus Omnitrophota bacterium]